MFERLVGAYFRVATSEVGGTLIVLAAMATCVLLVYLVWRDHDLERRFLLVVAAMMTILMFALYWLAVAAGTWRGAYFHTPPDVQAAILLPLLLSGWLAWLMAYRWLAARTRQSFAVAVATALVLVEAVALGDRLELGRGLVLLGPDGVVWVEALAGAALLIAPLAVFEMIRRGLGREVMP